MIIPRANVDIGSLANGSITLNNTSPADSNTSNQVSWQSACWPVITCMVTVIMQGTGRVLGVEYVFSAALRAFPFVCALDTVMTVVEFICLLNVGCSVATAARHVWYGRFEREGPHSTFDRLVGILDKLHLQQVEGDQTIPSWASDLAFRRRPAATTSSNLNPSGTVSMYQMLHRHMDNNSPQRAESPTRDSHLNTVTSTTIGGSVESSLPAQQLGMNNNGYYEGSSVDHDSSRNVKAFIIGAVPQAVKIFAMRGVPYTQVLISTYLLAFLVTELFRWTAGTAGEVELRPNPIVVRTKKAMAKMAVVMCFFASIVSVLLIFYWLMFLPVFEPHYYRPSKPLSLVESLVATMKFILLSMVLWAIAIMYVLIFWAFYTVIFIGPFSKFLQRLKGVTGSIGELVAACLTLSTLFSAFSMYSKLWTSQGTYKPEWVDYLG